MRTENLPSAGLPEPGRAVIGDVTAPLVREYRSHLEARAAAHLTRLPPRAVAAIEQALQEALQVACAQVLGLEFRRFLAWHDPLAFWIAAEGSRAPPEGPHEHAFTDTFLTEGWAATLRAYPLLARRLRTLGDDWVDGVIETLERLKTDRVALGAAFDRGRPPGPIESIRPGLSDPHDGGRTVWSMRFASGLEVLYKPKDLGSDQAFGELLEALEGPQAPLLPKVPAVLEGAGYGWAAHCSPKPCANEAAVRRYSLRAGALLALTHLLGAGDLHRQNLMARADVPVLVDTEALVGGGLFCPCAPPRAWSVRDTGLLPEVRPDRPGLGFDTSGLGEYAVAARSFVEEIVRGFTDTWWYLKRRGDVLLSAGGPIENLLRKPRRQFLRPSEAYALMLRRVTEPQCLRHPAEQSAVLNASLTRGPALEMKPPQRAAVLAAERRALAHADIPRFFFHPRDRTLRSGGRVLLRGLPDPFTMEWVQARLEGCSSESLRIEGDRIRQSFVS